MPDSLVENIESAYSDLADEQKLAERRESAEEQLADLGNDQISHLRKRAKNDLFFLAHGLLEYDLLAPNLHGHLCRWMEDTRDRQYRMILLPRGHYKSTLVTISDAVQMALPNDPGLEDYPHMLGPNIKLLLAHENRESASRFLFEVAQAFLEKPAMLALFPECIPNRNEQRINKWELELPRSRHHKEPTFDTIGAGGAAQGRHYHHIKLDDIIGKKARESETIMKRTIDWFDNINSLLTRPKIDGWDLVGTRWSYSDIYQRALDVYGADKAVSVIRAIDPKSAKDGLMPCYIRGALEDGEPIFPEEFSMEFFKSIRENPKVWAAQYANNPREGGLLEFNPDWLRYYNVTPGNRIVIFEGHSRRSLSIGELDICILIDPSVGESEDADETGIVVTGTDDDLNIYILETVKKRLKPPELINIMLRLFQKWQPRVISIEEVAFSATYKYWFQDECQKLGIAPSIHEYKPGSQKKKEARIRGLSNYFAAGQVYILEGMHDFRDEYEQFPLTDSDHLLDALAQGPEVWTEGLSEEKWDEFRRAEQKIQQMRSPVTGY